MIELLELKFSRRWQTNKIESDWSNWPRHSFSRQFRSPSCTCVWVTDLSDVCTGLSAITSPAEPEDLRIYVYKKFHRSKILDFMRRDYPSYNWSIATLDRCDI